MEEPLLYNYSSDIEDDEAQMLNNILENYDIECKSIERARSAYRIKTDNCDYCLKVLGKGYKRAEKSYFLSSALRENGFDNIARYVFTKDGKPLVKNKKSCYYLTEWIDGNEVDFKSIDDILDCARFLARFHNTSKNLAIPENIKIRNRHNMWKETFLDHIAAVEKFVQKIQGKSKKTGFDLIYNNNIHIFRAEAEFALQLIDTEEAKKAFDAAEKENYMCHDSFYYQNILRDKSGKLFLVDLESSQLDCPISDLGKFMRRILCKGVFKWDFDLCRQIIDAYDEIKPISHDELYPLLAILAFPHKYWKFGKKRYVRKKDWTEEEYQSKMKKIINMQKYKIDFVRNFMMFYNIS